jgi:hypothetical protein
MRLDKIAEVLHDSPSGAFWESTEMELSDAKFAFQESAPELPA